MQELMVMSGFFYPAPFGATGTFQAFGISLATSAKKSAKSQTTGTQKKTFSGSFSVHFTYF